VGTSVAQLSYGPLDNLILLTAKLHVEQLRPRQAKIQTVKRGDTVAHLFEVLIANNILSCPVVNLEGKYYGFVDMRDIVVHAASMFPEHSKDRLVKLLQKESQFSRTLVKDIMVYPVRKLTPFHPHRVGTSLFSALELLGKEGLHRIPVVNSDNEIQDIVTQSMMIDFVWQNIETITTVADLQVSQLDPPTRDLLTISSTAKAIEAFREMSNMEVTGLGVLAESGRLVDVISLRDLKLVNAWNETSFSYFWDTVSSYKSQLRTNFPNDFPPANPQVVLPTDTLYTVIEKMAIEHIHRVFVVDSLETMRPIRTITQTDVLRQLLKLEPIHPAQS
jgi:CBS-domain-containing membrane protein